MDIIPPELLLIILENLNPNIIRIVELLHVSRSFYLILTKKLEMYRNFIKHFSQKFKQIHDKYKVDLSSIDQIKVEIDKYLSNINNNYALISLSLWKRYPIPIISIFKYEEFLLFNPIKPLFYVIDVIVCMGNFRYTELKNFADVLTMSGDLFCYEENQAFSGIFDPTSNREYYDDLKMLSFDFNKLDSIADSSRYPDYKKEIKRYLGTETNYTIEWKSFHNSLDEFLGTVEMDNPLIKTEQQFFY